VFESVRTPKKLLAPGGNKVTNTKISKRTLKTKSGNDGELRRRKPKKGKLKPIPKEDTEEDQQIKSKRRSSHIDFFGRKFEKKDLENQMGKSKVQIFLIDKGKPIE
jgi:hypothetical protein